MRTALLLFLAARLQICAKASEIVAPIPNSPEDRSRESVSETSSEGFAAPKAPPPTEVTRAFVTREDGDSPTVVAQADLLQQQLYAKLPPGLWDAKAAFAIENALLHQGKNQASRASTDKAIQYTGIALFTLAFLGLSLLFLSDFNGLLTPPDTFFPSSMQPDEVPRAVNELLTTQKVVVFLSDDCPTCMAGLKDLERQAERPTAIVLTGHRLDRVIRKHLDAHYAVTRLPVIFVKGEPYAGFASAAQSLSKESRSSPRRSGDEGAAK